MRAFLSTLQASFAVYALTSTLSGVAIAQALPSTVMVDMPDGVQLATDVWRPLFDDTPKPVLLRRTPYGRGVDLQQAQGVVGAGYILVSQDVRGKGGSSGTFEPFFDDKVDGKATMEWIARQPWSNGKVGSYSNSAEGIVQYMAMALAPEPLRCAHIGMPTHDVYEAMFPGGAWRTELNTAWLEGQGAAAVVDLWKSHEVRDDYWNDATLSTEEMASIDHPVFILGGLFDIFAPSQVRALQQLQTNMVEAARQDVFLILGPWTHGGIALRGQGELFYPQEATYVDFGRDFIEYFAWCLQDGPRPDFPAVRYYLSELTDQQENDPADGQVRLVATGEWREGSSWPPPEGKLFAFYLHDDDRLRGDPPAGAGESVALTIDPADPAPSLGGGNLTTAAGPYDQSALDARPDVYVVQTEPVREVVELVGTPRAQLWVSSATSDLDVVARIEVLTAEGKAVAFADGVQRGRFVGGYDALRPLVPGEPALFDFELGPIALRLSPGQALRVAISSASNPRYEPNPNVAEPLANQPRPTATTLTLMRDAGHPSRVLLPVSAGRLPGMEDAPIESDAGVGGDAGSAGPTADAGPSERPNADAATGLDASASPMQELPPGAGCGCRVAPRQPASAFWLALSALLAPLLLRRLYSPVVDRRPRLLMARRTRADRRGGD